MSGDKDIAEIKATLASHGAQLTSHGQRLGAIEATLASHDHRLGSIEATLASHGQRLGSIEAMLASQGEQLASIKGTLAQMLPMMIRVVEGQARADERLAQQPPPAEFYELRGRVEEISRRLPTTLAYQQPPQRQS